MSERDRRPPGREGGLGPAARAFLQMSSGEAALEDEGPSRLRRLVALGLAVLVLIAVPLLWFTAGPGGQAVAVTASKSSSGPGGGDDDDSGPGGGDDDDDGPESDLSAATNGTTHATAANDQTAPGADDTGTGNSRASARTAGTTRATADDTNGTGGVSNRTAGTTRGTRGRAA